jgi:hypothetical protein
MLKNREDTSVAGNWFVRVARETKQTQQQGRQRGAAEARRTTLFSQITMKFHSNWCIK